MFAEYKHPWYIEWIFGCLGLARISEPNGWFTRFLAPEQANFFSFSSLGFRIWRKSGLLCHFARVKTLLPFLATFCCEFAENPNAFEIFLQPFLCRLQRLYIKTKHSWKWFVTISENIQFLPHADAYFSAMAEPDQKWFFQYTAAWIQLFSHIWIIMVGAVFLPKSSEHLISATLFYLYRLRMSPNFQKEVPDA